MSTSAFHRPFAFPASPRRRLPIRRGTNDVEPNAARSRLMETPAMTADVAENEQSTGVSATEAELRARFIAGLAGDATSYRRFLDGLSGHLRAYLRRRLPRAQADVEDILQETLLAVHNARHTYRNDQPLTAWVHAIARYKLMDFFRAHARREALHEPFEDDGHLFVDSDVEPADARRDA